MSAMNAKLAATAALAPFIGVRPIPYKEIEKRTNLIIKSFAAQGFLIYNDYSGEVVDHIVIDMSHDEVQVQLVSIERS